MFVLRYTQPHRVTTVRMLSLFLWLARFTICPYAMAIMTAGPVFCMWWACATGPIVLLFV